MGSTSTSSAAFAFTNVAGGGTPIASISGGVNGATYLTAQGILGTTANQTLTLGALGTGNVVLAPGGTTALTAQGANVSVAGTLGVGGALTAGSGITVSSGNVNLTGVTPSYQIAGVSVLSATTLGAGVLSSSLTGVGTITTGTWQAAVVGTGYGGTGQNFQPLLPGVFPTSSSEDNGNTWCGDTGADPDGIRGSSCLDKCGRNR